MTTADILKQLKGEFDARFSTPNYVYQVEIKDWFDSAFEQIVQIVQEETREKVVKDTAIKIVQGLDDFRSTRNEPNCGNVIAAQWGIMKGFGIEPEDLNPDPKSSKHEEEK